MTTITLSSDMESLLREKAEREGENPDAPEALRLLAEGLLADALTADAQDFEEACAALAEGLAQDEAGETIPMEQVIAESRERRLQMVVRTGTRLAADSVFPSFS